MGWTKACAVDALAPGDRQVVKVGNRKILVLNDSTLDKSKLPTC